MSVFPGWLVFNLGGVLTHDREITVHDARDAGWRALGYTDADALHAALAALGLCPDRRSA